MNKDKMELEESIEVLQKTVESNNEVIKEARKNGDINVMQLTADLDNQSIAIETVLQAIKDKDIQIAFYKKLYEDLKNDFENYKNGEDINYLDGIHHKKLVEKSIGQTIDKPEECWFDVVEVKIIIDDKLYNASRKKDFITLQDISDKEPNKCITVIAESPLSGAIYRYNNYGKREWQLIGTMLGYA